MLFNYEQHVHADSYSEHNHSRSRNGRTVNFLLFNNVFALRTANIRARTGLNCPGQHAALAAKLAPAQILGSVRSSV